MLSTDDEFRNIVFKEPIPNKKMKKHLIKTEDVPNEGSCRVLCYMDPNCVSINLGPFIQGKHICQLNNATDKSLAYEKGFTHLAVEVTSTFDLSLWAVLWYLSADRFSIFEECIFGLVYLPYYHGDQSVLKYQVATSHPLGYCTNFGHSGLKKIIITVIIKNSQELIFLP